MSRDLLQLFPGKLHSLPWMIQYHQQTVISLFSSFSRPFMSMLSSACSSGTPLLIFYHGNWHLLATFCFLSFNQLLIQKRSFVLISKLINYWESLMGYQCCHLSSCVLEPELRPPIQALAFSLPYYPSTVHPLGLFASCPSWFPLVLGYLCPPPPRGLQC